MLAIPKNLVQVARGVYVDPALVQPIPTRGATRGTTEAQGSVVLPEDHRMWSVASGGDREADGKQWSMADLNEAAVLLAGIENMLAKHFFQVLRSAPGRLFSVDEIIEAAPAGAFANASALAGSLLGFRKHVERAGRVYPFYWWKKGPSATLYAIRPSVAAVFDAAARRR